MLIVQINSTGIYVLFNQIETAVVDVGKSEATVVSRKNTDLLVSRFCCVNIEEIQNDLFFKSNENAKTESKAWNIPFTKEQLGWTVCISWHISYS